MVFANKNARTQKRGGCAVRGNRQAFTIVEMIVVVVIIAILAAISVVSYGAITRNARVTTLKGDLSTASSALIKQKAEKGGYPTSASAADPLFQPSEGVQIEYYYNSDDKTFCLNGVLDDQTYFITPDKTEAQQGACPAANVAGAPTLINFVTNPSIEVDTSNFTVTWGEGGAGTEARSTSGGAFRGAGHLRMTWSTPPTTMNSATVGLYPRIQVPAPSAGGKSYTASAYVRPSWSGGVFAFNLVPLNASLLYVGGEVFGSNVTLPSGQWTRLEATVSSAPAGTQYFELRLRARGGSVPTAGSTLDSDAWMLIQSADNFYYRDGSSANWSWNGTANLSASQGPRI